MRTHHKFVVVVRSEGGLSRQEAMQAIAQTMSNAAGSSDPQKLDILANVGDAVIHIQQKGTNP